MTASQLRCTSKSVDLYAGTSKTFRAVTKTVIRHRIDLIAQRLILNQSSMLKSPFLRF